MEAGELRTGETYTVLGDNGAEQNFRLTSLFGWLGLERKPLKSAGAGDIVAIAGMSAAGAALNVAVISTGTSAACVSRPAGSAT